MKRPTYLKIGFPVPFKVHSRPAVRGYFGRLAGKTVEISYGQQRSRKVFWYKAKEVVLTLPDDWPCDKKGALFFMELELIEDPS